MAKNKKPAPIPEQTETQPVEVVEVEKDYAAIEEVINGADGGDWSPAAAGPEESEASALGVQEIKALTMLTFGIAATRLGPHWSLAEVEAQGLAEATDKVLQKYLGAVEMGPEVALIITAGMIILPRVALTVSQPPKPEPKPKETEKQEGAVGGDKSEH